VYRRAGGNAGPFFCGAPLLDGLLSTHPETSGECLAGVCKTMNSLFNPKPIHGISIQRYTGDNVTEAAGTGRCVSGLIPAVLE